MQETWLNYPPHISTPKSGATHIVRILNISSKKQFAPSVRSFVLKAQCTWLCVRCGVRSVEYIVGLVLLLERERTLVDRCVWERGDIRVVLGCIFSAWLLCKYININYKSKAQISSDVYYSKLYCMRSSIPLTAISTYVCILAKSHTHTIWLGARIH